MHCSPQPNISMDPGEKKRKGPKVFLSTTTSSDFYCCFFNSSLLSSNSHLKTHRNINHICSGPPQKVQKAPLRNTPSFTPKKDIQQDSWIWKMPEVSFLKHFTQKGIVSPCKRHGCWWVFYRNDLMFDHLWSQGTTCSSWTPAHCCKTCLFVCLIVCLLVSKTCRLVLVVVVVVVVVAAAAVVVVVVQQDGMCTVHQESSDYLTVWRFP